MSMGLRERNRVVREQKATLIRGTPSWDAWVRRLRDAAGCKSMAEIYVVGIQALADRIGFEPPPPRL